MEHLLRGNVEPVRVVERSLVDKDYLTSPVVDLELVVLPEGFLVGCMVLVGIFSVDSTGNFEGPIDALLLGLAAKLGHLSTDVMPSHALTGRSSGVEGLRALGDSPGAFLVAVVFRSPSYFNIERWNVIVLLVYFGWCIILGIRPLNLVVGGMLLGIYMLLRI